MMDRVAINLSALVQGIALGLFSDKGIDSVADHWYAKRAQYSDPKYNEQGLFDWEAESIRRWYQPGQAVAVIAAGGGREVLALDRLGFAVQGFECLPLLVDEANRLLERLGCSSQVAWCAPNAFPELPQRVDHVIVGWGGYTHIRGRARRISLLQQIHRSLDSDGTVLVSFWPRPGIHQRFYAIARIANFLRKLKGVADRIEPGDSMVPLYVHHFRKVEIETEFSEAGFELVHFDIEPYGYAVGKRH
jgi:hypothetical protein